jgi:hypothetical protein
LTPLSTMRSSTAICRDARRTQLERGMNELYLHKHLSVPEYFHKCHEVVTQVSGYSSSRLVYVLPIKSTSKHLRWQRRGIPNSLFPQHSFVVLSCATIIARSTGLRITHTRFWRQPVMTRSLSVVPQTQLVVYAPSRSLALYSSNDIDIELRVS